MTKPKDKPKVPLGKPLNLSNEDLDRLSQVTPEDIEKVKDFVSKASPQLHSLLNAKPIKGTKQKKKPMDR